jgi:hypothetical protein
MIGISSTHNLVGALRYRPWMRTPSRISVPPSSLLTGLVAHHKYEEASGTAADQLGNYALTASNNPVSGTGKIGNGRAYVAASSQKMFNSGVPSTSETKASIVAWFNRTNNTKNFSIGFTTTNGNRFGFRSIGATGYGMAENGTTNCYNTYNTSTWSGGYLCVVVVYDGTQGTNVNRIQVYINSTLAGISTQNNTFPATYQVTGDYTHGQDVSAGTFSDVILDEVSLYLGVALTQTQVTNRFNAENAGNGFPWVGVP